MNPKLVIHTGIAIASLALLAPELAQGQAASAPAVPVAAKAVIGVTVAETQLLATGNRATKLLKQDVYNDKGDKIGTVDDLVLSPDGTLSTAIVNVGASSGWASTWSRSRSSSSPTWRRRPCCPGPARKS